MRDAFDVFDAFIEQVGAPPVVAEMESEKDISVISSSSPPPSSLVAENLESSPVDVKISVVEDITNESA